MNIHTKSESKRVADLARGCEEGLLDRQIFWDDEVYRQEIERIFKRCWLFVAHESQIPQRGDYVSTYMGEDSVLVVRQRDGSISVLLNVCPHRGNRVCHAEAGTANTFVCNYHGWSFGHDGRLVAMHESAAFNAEPGFDRSKNGLTRVAKVSSYKGFVFATWDSSAPSLDDYLGDYRWYLDVILDNDEGGTEFLPGVMKNVIRCNWKTPVENFVGDALHAGWTHESGVRAMLGSGVPSGCGSTESYQINHNGHAWQFNLDYPFGNAATFGSKAVVQFLREREPFVTERLGALRSRMVSAVSSAAVFPNLSFLPGQSTFRAWHPRGPHEVEQHSWVLVNRNYPPEIKEIFRKGVMMTFSPAGLFEMDDGENWEFVTRTNRGLESRRQRSNYVLGSNTAITHPELRGNVYRGQINDANLRAFYQRWGALMRADSWTEIKNDECRH